MLLKLLRQIDKERFEPFVVSLGDEGVFGRLLERSGIPVVCLNWKRDHIPWIRGLSLVRALRKLEPQIVQGWMYHGNVAALLAAKLGLKTVPVIWGIRGTHIDIKKERTLSALVIWLGARLSKYPKKIVNNSYRSASLHATELGYAIDNCVVIPNGFDTDQFVPSMAARLNLRRELGLQEGAKLIGLVARFHEMKNHSGFLRSAYSLRNTDPDVNYVMVGEGVNSNNKSIMGQISDLAMQDRVHLLGSRHDMPQVFAAMDIVSVTSTYGEGFPNVIGEAMSCGVPCVVTDVGDSKWIVGDCGITVPPNDDNAFTLAWRSVLQLPEHERLLLGLNARRRVEDYFSIAQVARQYEELYYAVSGDSAVIAK